MADYKEAIDKTLQWEGGWADVKGDRGGCTNFGITLSTYQVYHREATKEDLKNISMDEVYALYRDMFWNPLKAGIISNQSLANLIFDICVNSGTGMIKHIQSAIGVVADGKIGPVTLGRLNSAPKECFEAIKEWRIRFYNRIVDNDASQKKFLKGWLRRINEQEYSE